MRELFLYLAIISFILAGIFLFTSIMLFFKLDIRSVFKDKGGLLEQKQIEEIRAKNSGAQQYRRRVNIFEELEKRAKLENGMISDFRTTANPEKISQSIENGTTVLRKPEKEGALDFVIEKNMMFVCTDEVI